MLNRKIYQITFVLAGCYNIFWGLFVGLYPGWFFQYAGMSEPNHPEIFQCLGMVIGLYGILYLNVARRPEHGHLIALVGIIGKILGPIGAAYLVFKTTWPPQAFVLCIFNDLIWWLPFGYYLLTCPREIVQSSINLARVFIARISLTMID